MIKVLIIEDEHPAAQRLEKMLLETAPDCEIQAHCDSIETSLEYLKSHPLPDLILLDIQLGDGLSFAIFRQVNVDCPVIFTTAYDEFALKAFELNSIDYLLKPINREKLEQSILKFRKRITPVDPRLLASLSDNLQRVYKQRFLVNSGTGLVSIHIAEVAYFYSVERATYLVSRSGKSYIIEYSLDKLENLVSLVDFFRINRQYLVSIPAIQKIHIHSKSRIKLTLQPEANNEVVVSNARAHDFRMWLDQ